MICPRCHDKMIPEHAHYKCPRCNFMDHCCEGHRDVGCAADDLAAYIERSNQKYQKDLLDALNSPIHEKVMTPEEFRLWINKRFMD